MTAPDGLWYLAPDHGYVVQCAVTEPATRHRRALEDLILEPLKGSEARFYSLANSRRLRFGCFCIRKIDELIPGKIRVDRDVEQSALTEIHDVGHAADGSGESAPAVDAQTAGFLRNQELSIWQIRHAPRFFQSGQSLDPKVATLCRNRTVRQRQRRAGGAFAGGRCRLRCRLSGHSCICGSAAAE